MITVLFLAKNSHTSIDVWAEALSCFKIHYWEKKIQRNPSPVIAVVEAGLRFCFWPILQHKYRCVSWSVIMVQNPWLIFPQFCAFLMNCFAQSAHNFKIVLLIDHATLWQEFMMHYAIAIKENSEQNLHIWPNLMCFFRSLLLYTFPLGWLDFGFNAVAIHSRFVARFGLFIKSWSWSSLNVVNISWLMSMRRCFCSKLSNLETIFAPACFMSITYVKINWHEPNDMPTSSATSLIGIRRLFKTISFTASMFSSVVDVHRH